MPVRGDQRVNAERRRSANDCTEIVRIGDLVEDEDDSTGLCEVGNVAGLERAGFEQDALVHGLRAETCREIL